MNQHQRMTLFMFLLFKWQMGFILTPNIENIALLCATPHKQIFINFKMINIISIIPHNLPAFQI